jgi:hypothetical protein
MNDLATTGSSVPQIGYAKPLLCVGFLLLPFLIQTLTINEALAGVVKSEQRRVLVTALSFNASAELKMFGEKNFDELQITEELKTRKKGIQWNWLPVIRMINFHENLEEVILIQSNEVKRELEGAKGKPDEDDMFERMLRLRFGNKIKYTPVLLTQIDNFNELYLTAKGALEVKLKKYNSEQIIFGISSGPATITAAFIFLSMPGQRGVIYQRQNAPYTLDPFTVDINTTQDLWSEVFEKLV